MTACQQLLQNDITVSRAETEDILHKIAKIRADLAEWSA